jgi:hypothetical protein
MKENQMTRDKVIEAGFLMEVSTWENDGDAPMTKSKTFKTIEEVKKVIRFLNGFHAEHTHEEGYYGNAETYGNSSNELCDESGVPHSTIALIGSWADGEYYRVLSKIAVFEVPEEIRLRVVVF